MRYCAVVFAVYYQGPADDHAEIEAVFESRREAEALAEQNTRASGGRSSYVVEYNVRAARPGT